MWGYTDCRAVSEMLWNYTAHRLSEQDVERVEKHIADCGACRAEAEAYRQTVDALASMRRTPIPDSRRGWHELRARLSTPERRPIAPPLWRTPMFAWGATALAAALFVTFVNPLGNRILAPSGGGNEAPQSRGRDTGTQAALTPDAQDETNGDAAIDPETLYAYADEVSGTNAPNGASASSIRPLRRPLHHPTQLAEGGPSGGHRRFAGSPGRARLGRALDYAHMDGKSAANGRDNSDYVLTPISAEAEPDSATDYVMGSVLTTGRSSDAEVARGW